MSGKKSASGGVKGLVSGDRTHALLQICPSPYETRVDGSHPISDLAQNEGSLRGMPVAVL